MPACQWIIIATFVVLPFSSNGQSSWQTYPENPYSGSRQPIGISRDNYGYDQYRGTSYGNTMDPFIVLYEWSKLDFTWPDETMKVHSLSNKRFIPENNAISGIKAWRDRIFVTIPRWKLGVPATVATVPAYSLSGNSPRLVPFPDWKMQEIGNCTALQSVKGIEIDTEGRIWILDSGRVNSLGGGTPQSKCPPKLVIIDLNTVNFPYGSQPSDGQPTPVHPGFLGPVQQYPNQQYPNNNQQPYPNQQYPNINQQYPNQNQQYPNQKYQTNQMYPNQNQQYAGQYPNQQYPNQYQTQNQYPNQQQYPNQYNNQYNPNQFGVPNQGGYQHGGNYQYGSHFRIVKSFVFPSHIATEYGSHLNDIVLDNSNGWYAYITDSGNSPGIIVYSFLEDRAWKVQDARSMKADPDTRFMAINNIDVEMRERHIRGIALSPQTGYDRTLYFSPGGSYNIYSIATSILKNPSIASDVSSYITDHGRKESMSDGMTMDNRGNLYYGLLTMNAIGVWNTRNEELSNAHRIMSRDNIVLQWVDSFAIDDSGHMYVVTNRLQNFLTGRVIPNEVNYRILKAPIGSRSYFHYQDTTNGVASFSDQNYFHLYYYDPNSAMVFRTAKYLFISLFLFILGR